MSLILRGEKGQKLTIPEFRLLTRALFKAANPFCDWIHFIQTFRLLFQGP